MEPVEALVHLERPERADVEFPLVERRRPRRQVAHLLVSGVVAVDTVADDADTGPHQLVHQVPDRRDRIARRHRVEGQVGGVLGRREQRISAPDQPQVVDDTATGPGRGDDVRREAVAGPEQVEGGRRDEQLLDRRGHEVDLAVVGVEDPAGVVGDDEATVGVEQHGIEGDRQHRIGAHRRRRRCWSRRGCTA
jgi:hypothetical protein